MLDKFGLNITEMMKRKKGADLDYVAKVIDAHRYNTAHSSFYRIMFRIYEVYKKVSIKNIVKLLLGYESIYKYKEKEILTRRSFKLKKKDSLITGEAFNNNYYGDKYDVMEDANTLYRDIDKEFSQYINKEFALRPKQFSYNFLLKGWLYSLGDSNMHFFNENTRGWNFWVPRSQVRWFAFKRRRYFYRKLINKDKWYNTNWMLPDQLFSTNVTIPHARRRCDHVSRSSDFLLEMTAFHLKVSMFLLSREFELFIELVDKQKLPAYTTPLDLWLFSWSIKGIKLWLINRVRLFCYYTPKRIQDFFLQYSINLRTIISVTVRSPIVFYNFISYKIKKEPGIIERANKHREEVAIYHILDKHLKRRKPKKDKTKKKTKK